MGSHVPIAMTEGIALTVSSDQAHSLGCRQGFKTSTHYEVWQ